MVGFQIVPVDRESAVIEIGAALDFGTAADFRKTTSRLITMGIKNFVLDFSSTKLLDSSGLGSLLSLCQRTFSRQGRILIAEPSFAVEVVLLLTRLYKILPKYDTVEEARFSLEQGPS